MATEEHKCLADVVKGTHARLRAECRRYGAEAAWARHVARNDVLQKYAASMRKLATECWADNNNSNSRNGTYCRMKWIRTRCEDYFFNGDEERYERRERDISARMAPVDVTTSGEEDSRRTPGDEPRVRAEGRGSSRDASPTRRISLLDVGSCYNPLGNVESFDVTAIDLIAAATERVYRCDFLNVPIGAERILSRDGRLEILQLAANSFDAVVFSLLLEYLPCPRQRHVCCAKAHDVLRSGGLLIIVSPDSKHVGANARLMRSWRYALSKLGFMRVAYEKLPHIHCLAFRKCARKSVAARWADMRRSADEDDRRYRSETELFIPQDFQRDFRPENAREHAVDDEYDEADVAGAFSQLPFGNGAP